VLSGTKLMQRVLNDPTQALALTRPPPAHAYTHTHTHTHIHTPQTHKHARTCRRDTLRASKIMQQRALNNPKIEVLWNSAVDSVGVGRADSSLPLIPSPADEEEQERAAEACWPAPGPLGVAYQPLKHCCSATLFPPHFSHPGKKMHQCYMHQQHPRTNACLQAYGNERGVLGGLKIKNLVSGQVTDLECNGLFFAIGHKPATSFLEGQVRSLLGIFSGSVYMVGVRVRVRVRPPQHGGGRPSG